MQKPLAPTNPHAQSDTSHRPMVPGLLRQQLEVLGVTHRYQGVAAADDRGRAGIESHLAGFLTDSDYYQAELRCKVSVYTLLLGHFQHKKGNSVDAVMDS